MIRMVSIAAVCLTSVGCAVMSTDQLVAYTESGRPVDTPHVTPADLTKLQTGSQVKLTCPCFQSTTVHEGTVLKSSAYGVALMNCKRKTQANRQPPGRGRPDSEDDLAVREELIPVFWIPIVNITSVDLIAPPAPDYVVPQLDIDTESGQSAVERIGVSFDYNVKPWPWQRTLN
jgi:hypothetical protein